MELTHRDKDIIKSVIEGFTYHQKYKLYVELAKDLKEEDQVTRDLIKDLKEDVKFPEQLVKDLENSKVGGDLIIGLDKIDRALKPKSSRSKK